MERADLELVMAIQQHRSLTAAAAALGVSTPVVSKRLAALEARVRHPLFTRTTRQVAPTAEGEWMCERAAVLLAGFAALDGELLERRTQPTGQIRLVSSLGFGRQWLGPALAAFHQLYPQVRIELELTEHLPDLEAERFDGAVWLWTPQERRFANWVTRRLARNQRVLVAAPDYLARRGTPLAPADLAQHDCLVTRENGGQGADSFNVWQLSPVPERGPVTRVQVQGPLASNSGEMVRDWCLQGHGIMLRSLWDVAPRLANGELVRVLPRYAMTDADVHWLMPRLQNTPKRLRLLIDHLVAHFKDAPWQDAFESH